MASLMMEGFRKRDVKIKDERLKKAERRAHGRDAGFGMQVSGARNQ